MIWMNVRVWLTALIPTRNEVRDGLLIGGGLFVLAALAGGPVLALLA